jgi:hypothetical protein
MKKTVSYILTTLFLVNLGSACTDDFDEVNKNPNKIYEVTPQHVFPGVVYKTLTHSAELNYRYFSWQARYVLINAAPNDADDTSGAFTNFYVKVLKDLKKLEDTYVGLEGYQNAGCMILTWKAYVYSILVAAFGGVPMSEAISVSDDNVYRYDSEAEIYMEILRLLEQSAAEFDPQGDKLKLDPVFRTSDGSSDIEKWRKFANTLRLDIALRIQNMDAALAEKHIRGSLEHEDQLISSVSDIAKGQWGTNINADASYYYKQFVQAYELGTNTSVGVTTYPRINQYFFLYLRSYKDPRLAVYGQRTDDAYRFKVTNDTLTRPTTGDPATRDSILVEYLIPYLPLRESNVPRGWVVGIDPNSPSGTQTYIDPYTSNINDKTWTLINKNFIKPDAEQVFLNWADACFMKAEVAVKYPGLLSKPAEEYYYEGISAAFAEYGLSASYSDYIKQDGIKWNTNGKGLSEYRGFYAADINGEGGDENHLEQIYKQRYIADFFNGNAGWTLERRTRVMKYPPFFYSNVTNEGGNGICDFTPERLLYPKKEMNYNRDAYYDAIANLQSNSATPNPARWGDNFYTALRITKANPLSLDSWIIPGQVEYNARFINKWYGKTQEEFILNAGKDYPAMAANATGLARYIGYKVTLVLSTYEVAP